MTDYRFHECPTCAAKSGTPILCSSCLANRRAIMEQGLTIAQQRRDVQRLTDRCDRLHQRLTQRLSDDEIDRIADRMLNKFLSAPCHQYQFDPGPTEDDLAHQLDEAKAAARFCFSCSRMWERYREIALEKWPWLTEDEG